MTHTQILAIKKILIVIMVFLCLGCLSNKDQNSLFSDTYSEILTDQIFADRYIIPPTPEEFNSGFRTEAIRIHPDSLPTMNLYVQKEHLDFDFNQIRVKLPEAYKFAYHSKKAPIDYLPNHLEKFNSKKYQFITISDLDSFVNGEKVWKSSNGRILQFSKVLLNDKNNKALLFIRDTYDQLDSNENLILLEKVDKKWKVHSSIGRPFG